MSYASASPRLVLVVDDDPDFCCICCEALVAEGYVVRAVGSTVAAFELMRAVVPDVVVMDIEVGGQDGLAATRAIRGEPRTSTVPVIVCSGYSDPETMRRARAHGASSFLKKPFAITELVSVVAAQLGAAGAADQEVGR